jgi:hypothetical protein
MSLVYLGAALALAGAGTASAATVVGSAALPAAGAGAAAIGPAPAGAALAGAARPATPKSAASPESPVRHQAQVTARKPAGRPADRRARVLTWKQVRDELNRQTNPAAARHGRLPLADRLKPVGTRGPQAWMPLSGTQVHNATTIVAQALHHKMGIRSAVIAVATSMQESRLLNIDYGDSDSLGLFQQRPSCGWGSERQILHPAYAADAFLRALRRHQAIDRAWAGQPLWANAQSVQNSGFPFAYAKWEDQAADLVKGLAGHLL